MRSTIRDNVKGVATMKFFVAVLLVLTTFSSGAVTLGQNPPGRTADKSASKPQDKKSDTIKICQGIPIPDGYVIVAYLTSAACPHGAYLLKRQNDYESSLAVNGNGQPATDQTTTKTSSSTAKSTSPRSGRTG